MSTALFALLATVASLQAPEASVVGEVRDAGSREPLVGVEVMLPDPST